MNADICTLTHHDDASIARIALAYLERVVAIDSQSDERSDTIPSTEGQRVLGEEVARIFAGLGATVERDAFANVIATLPGRGAGAGAPALALMVHLDTARGTAAVPKLTIEPAWDGSRLTYRDNDGLHVSVENYPSVSLFVGQDVVHGPGAAPFGLDDKLGLTHLLTLAHLLAEERHVPHPPLILVGRPDEEVGRMEAVVELASQLAGRGVRSGYTVDGLLPFEINVENFNGAHATLTFPDRELIAPEGAVLLPVRFGGVNTHGATAKAEGSRSATRLVAEAVAAAWRALPSDRRPVPVAFTPDPLRDCDADVVLLVPDAADVEVVAGVCGRVIEPHLPRGASLAVRAATRAAGPFSTAAADAIAFVARFIESRPGFVLLPEESDDREGYSAPYRARPVAGGVELDIRIRDFEPAGLAARKAHVAQMAAAAGVKAELHDQYINMGPALAARPELVAWARAAAEALGIDAPERPIRGGTGVDPFLAQGIAVANLGTGYFAPESEKELTTLELMARHARWLCALVATVATA